MSTTAHGRYGSACDNEALIKRLHRIEGRVLGIERIGDLKILGDHVKNFLPPSSASRKRATRRG